jgi:hypothetical protein
MTMPGREKRERERESVCVCERSQPCETCTVLELQMASRVSCDSWDLYGLTKLARIGIYKVVSPIMKLQ